MDVWGYTWSFRQLWCGQALSEHLLYFAQKVCAACQSCCSLHVHTKLTPVYLQLVSAWVLWSDTIQLKFVLPVEQVEVLSVLSGRHPFVRTASSLMSQTACSISFLSFITCNHFLLILWCLLTTLNDITFNLNMNALLKLGDTRKLECRNWLADDQDRVRWRHLL